MYCFYLQNQNTMMITQQIARQFREVHFGKNWTSSNLKDTLKGITWQQANVKIYELNSIVALVFHINYYVKAILKVLQEGILDASDKYSFDHPKIESQKDWDKLLTELWSDAYIFADLVEDFPENQLNAIFSEEKYGNFYHNFHGVIEHTHYHLGQIVVIKKIILQQKTSSKS